jgi:hypothetical protein
MVLIYCRGGVLSVVLTGILFMLVSASTAARVLIAHASRHVNVFWSHIVAMGAAKESRELSEPQMRVRKATTRKTSARCRGPPSPVSCVGLLSYSVHVWSFLLRC